MSAHERRVIKERIEVLELKTYARPMPKGEMSDEDLLKRLGYLTEYCQNLRSTRSLRRYQ